MKKYQLILIVLLTLFIAGCGNRHVSTLANHLQPIAWVGDQDSMLSDIYQICVPYGVVIPIRQHGSKGFIVQSRSFPEGFKTYTLIVTLLPTQSKDEESTSITAYGISIACEDSDLISSGVEEKLLNEITSRLNIAYKKAIF